MLSEHTPFPGLRPYGEEDSAWFFGRSAEINDLLKRLRRLHFVAVVGASGSGKSSLVRAGVLPQVRDGYLDAEWLMATFRPGDRPIANLAEALAPVLPHQSTAMLREALESGPRGLVLSLDTLAEPAPGSVTHKVLLVVDQFEELFQYAQRAGEAAQEEVKQFLKLLLTAAASDDVPVYVMVTMRIEWLNECATYVGMAEAINEGLYLVPQMSRQQFSRAILGPLDLAGGTITGSLVDRMLNDLDSRSDQLPVMQHALMRIWERSGAHAAFDLAVYEAVGTFSNCLSAHAEEVYAELDSRGKLVAEKLFRAITQVNRNRKVRRPRPVSEISAETGVPLPELAAVIEAFRRPGRSFLVSTEGSLGTHSVIDLSHEALIRQWTRLGHWVDAEAEVVSRLQRLREDASDWDRDHQAYQACLYRGSQLERAEELRPLLADASREAQFLYASERAHLWRRVRTRGLVLCATLLAVVLLFVYFSARSERARESVVLANAEKQRAEAEASVANLQARKAEQFQASIVQQIDAAKGSATALAAIAQNIQAERVYLQFTAGGGALAHNVQTHLKQRGYAVPEVVQVATGSAPAHSEVRYFRPEDQTEAAKLASLLHPLVPGDLAAALSPNAKGVVPAGQFEVWLVPAASPAAAATSTAQSTTPAPAAIAEAPKPAPAPAAPVAPVAAPGLTLSLSKDSVLPGTGSTLTWHTDGAAEVSIDGIGAVQPSGSMLLTPQQSTSYRVVAKNAGGTTEKSVSLAVTTPAPAPPQPAVAAAVALPAASPTGAVKAALERYRQAFESESMDDLRHAWPTMSTAQQRNARFVFDQFNAIHLELKCADSDIVVSGASANATCQQIAIYTQKGKRQPEQSAAAHFQLRREGEGWVVAAVQ